MTLSWGVVVVEALWSMKPMKDLRGSAVDRVALCGEAEGGARNTGGAKAQTRSKSVGNRYTRRGQRVAGMLRCGRKSS
jgi:hypothetical protein